MKKIKKKKNYVDIHEVMRDVSKQIEHNANVKAVFGDPIKFDNRTLIPVANIMVMGGGGVGPKGKGNPPVGGGLRMESKPVGYIEITENGAKFVPTVDMSKLALKGIFSGVFAVGMFGLASLVRAFKKDKKSK